MKIKNILKISLIFIISYILIGIITTTTLNFLLSNSDFSNLITFSNILKFIIFWPLTIWTYVTLIIISLAGRTSIFLYLGYIFPIAIIMFLIWLTFYINKKINISYDKKGIEVAKT